MHNALDCPSPFKLPLPHASPPTHPGTIQTAYSFKYNDGIKTGHAFHLFLPLVSSIPTSTHSPVLQSLVHKTTASAAPNRQRLMAKALPFWVAMGGKRILLYRAVFKTSPSCCQTPMRHFPCFYLLSMVCGSHIWWQDNLGLEFGFWGADLTFACPPWPDMSAGHFFVNHRCQQMFVRHEFVYEMNKIHIPLKEIWDEIFIFFNIFKKFNCQTYFLRLINLVIKKKIPLFLFL